MKTKIAFIGLGAMGFPMAGHLARAKYNVSVFNRTISKSDSWLKQFKGRKGRTIAETVFDSEFVFSCVGNDQDLREILLGDDGAVANLKKGAIIVDHTTTSAQVAVDVGKECEKHGIFFLDAPVSGGQDGAIKGELSVMCGGDLDAFLKAQIVMDSYARNIVRIGGIGQGQLTKMVNQICIAGLLQGCLLYTSPSPRD